MRLEVLTALLRGGLDMSTAYGDALGGKPHRAYVFLALRQASFAKAVREAGREGSVFFPTSTGRPLAPITLRGLAASVNLPVETCRAVVELMLERKICEQTDRGLVATSAAWTDSAVYAADNAALQSLSDFAAALEGSDNLLAERIGESAAEAQHGFPVDRARLLTPWIDFVLRQLEIFIPLAGDGLNAILVASIASILFRRTELVTDANYIEAVQALDATQGVATSELAVVSGLPRETVRRRLTQLEERRFVGRGSEGRWVLNPARAFELSLSLPLLEDPGSAGSRLMRELDRVIWPVGETVAPRSASLSCH